MLLLPFFHLSLLQVSFAIQLLSQSSYQVEQLMNSTVLEAYDPTVAGSFNVYMEKRLANEDMSHSLSPSNETLEPLKTSSGLVSVSSCCARIRCTKSRTLTFIATVTIASSCDDSGSCTTTTFNESQTGSHATTGSQTGVATFDYTPTGPTTTLNDTQTGSSITSDNTQTGPTTTPNSTDAGTTSLASSNMLLMTKRLTIRARPTRGK